MGFGRTVQRLSREMEQCGYFDVQTVRLAGGAVRRVIPIQQGIPIEAALHHLRAHDFGVALQFGNYR